MSDAGRTGINPAPTVDVCNTLVINGLPSQRLRKAGRIRPLVGLEEAKEYNYSVDRPNLCGYKPVLMVFLCVSAKIRRRRICHLGFEGGERPSLSQALKVQMAKDESPWRWNRVFMVLVLINFVQGV